MAAIATGKQSDLLQILQTRFANHPERHTGISWGEVESRLLQSPDKLHSLHEMENSGGEPDVVGKDKSTGAIIFFDCAPESPKGRRSVCYDPESLASRKENKPKDSAIGMAKNFYAELLSEDEYRYLQTLGEFDLKTSSWLKTPAEVRDKGGAIFGDRRYGRVFTYHNGAESYYAARGFRTVLYV